MKNTSTFDKDLNPIVEIASSEDLEPLVEYLSNKFSEDLTGSDAYKENFPDHRKYADLIAKEIREMGGNSIANVYRGEGPKYHEMVCDVAKKFNAPYNPKKSVEDIENAILETILTTTIDKMSEEEKNQLFAELEGKGAMNLSGMSAAAFLAIFRAGGFQSYQLTLIIANQIAKIVLGHGLKLAVNAGLVRFASILAGPIGLTVSAIWATVDIAGPSFKVTIPCVIQIALLRKKFNSINCSKCEEVLQNNESNFCPTCGEAIS